VFDNINREQAARIACGFNGQFPEIWWLYPDAAGVEPNRYVIWNFQTNLWYGGALQRCAVTEPAAFGFPMMGDETGQVFLHENGWTDDGTPRGLTVFAESGDMVVGEADQAIYLAQMMPDFQGYAEPNFHLFGRWEPEDVEEDWGIFPYVRSDGLIDVDQETRRLRMRIENVDPALFQGEPPWVLGQIRGDIRPGAGR
jgi:hypothetical protein